MADTATSTRAPAGATNLVTDNPDAAIMTAWGRHMAARARYDALPFSDVPGLLAYTPEELLELDEMDAAEAIVHKAIASTPKGVEVKLWLALGHTLTSREDDKAARDGNLAYFDAQDDHFDWNARLILSAIRSLRAMGGEA